MQPLLPGLDRYESGRKRQPTYPSESSEARRLWRWIQENQVKHPELLNAFHIPNGKKRDPATAALLKLEGVRAGVPDYFIAHPDPLNEYAGLWIELKRADGGELSDAQKDWIERLSKARFKVIVASGATDAIAGIMQYLTPTIN
jgi:hypothetical protein